MSVWFFIIICTGTAWCFPEHTHWRTYTTYATKQECEEAGRKDPLVMGSRVVPSSEKWVAVCLEGVR